MNLENDDFIPNLNIQELYILKDKGDFSPKHQTSFNNNINIKDFMIQFSRIKLQNEKINSLNDKKIVDKTKNEILLIKKIEDLKLIEGGTRTSYNAETIQEKPGYRRERAQSQLEIREDNTQPTQSTIHETIKQQSKQLGELLGYLS